MFTFCIPGFFAVFLVKKSQNTKIGCSKLKKMHKISEKMAEKVEHAFANLFDVHKILETFLSLFQKICPPKFVCIFGFHLLKWPLPQAQHIDHFNKWNPNMQKILVKNFLEQTQKCVLGFCERQKIRERRNSIIIKGNQE